ncbi:MAG: hypothetical protein Q4F72_02175 [Desulfovibrionaceae bacterium]|nr:hypothetical protein [Desulfovibrionaceae bacterium]
MREYVLTDFSAAAREKLENFLKEMGWSAGLDDLYWLPVPPEALSELQRAHADCRPHVTALELTGDGVRMELLVRARNNLRCDCIAYATPEQAVKIIGCLHDILASLDIDC